MPKSSSNPIHRLASTLGDLHERHKERHRPTGFGFAFADRVGFLDAAHWSAVTRHGTLLLQPETLRVMEHHGPKNLLPRYAMVFREDRPVAAIAAQIVLVTGDRLGRE